MEQTDQSKETYTLFYLENGQYKLRYENDNFGKQVIIDSRYIGDQGFVKENLQSIDQSCPITFTEACNFDAYVPLSFTEMNKIRSFFMQKTFEQMQAYNGIYTFLGCSDNFINIFDGVLLLKACQKYTKLGACIKKYFLIWKKSTYLKEFEALDLCENEKKQFNKISNTILQDVMHVYYHKKLTSRLLKLLIKIQLKNTLLIL